MANLYDLAYGAGVTLGAPLWLARSRSRRKVLAALRQRRGVVPQRTGEQPAVLIHAVSVGEVNATPALVQQLQTQRLGLQIIVSTTSDTGYARAQALYGSAAGLSVVRFPLDFGGWVGRWLEALRPSVVVLMEGELWPNFLLQCERRDIPVVLVNGRMTSSAYRNYRLVRPVAAGMMRRLAAACVQDEIYRQRFLELGMPAERLSVTGTMKFDTAQPGDGVPGDEELAGAVGLAVHDVKQPVWVCASTGPGEEAVVLGVYRSLLLRFPLLRLVIVPRHPERFDAVAQLIVGAGLPLRRRTGGGSDAGAAVILGDTMGELRKFYSLADFVFVGRTLVDLGPRQHGSDMIEPAALGRPVVVGPWTGNFAEVMNRFRAAGAMVEVKDGKGLEGVIVGWLTDRAGASELGRKARDVVRANRGATARHAAIVLAQLERKRTEPQMHTDSHR